MVSFDGLLQIYKTDTDNAYGIQCMDLMHVYIKYVLGLEDLSILAAPNAKSVWLNFKSEWAKYFIKIPNTPTGVPLKGDIVFWDGTDGHVAIFMDGSVNDFYSFDANYPVGTYPHRQYHNYYQVLGWLRFIPQPVTDYKKLYEDELAKNTILFNKIKAAKAALG